MAAIAADRAPVLPRDQARPATRMSSNTAGRTGADELLRCPDADGAEGGKACCGDEEPAAGHDAEHCAEDDAEHQDSHDEGDLVVLAELLDGEVLHRPGHSVDDRLADRDHRALPAGADARDQLADPERCTGGEQTRGSGGDHARPWVLFGVVHALSSEPPPIRMGRA